MTPESVTALAGAFAAMSTAFSALFLKMWTAFTKRDRYRDAQIGLLWRMVDLRDDKLEETAKASGVSVNGAYEARKEAQRREWEDLVRRGEA